MLMLNLFSSARIVLAVAAGSLYVYDPYDEKPAGPVQAVIFLNSGPIQWITLNFTAGSSVGLSGYYVPDDTVSHISRRSIRTNRSKSASIADLTGKPNYAARQTSIGKPGRIFITYCSDPSENKRFRNS